MKYFFVLGRNPELSRAEVFSYFKTRGVLCAEEFFEKNILVVTLNKECDFEIAAFGGVFCMGRVLFHGAKNLFETYLEREDVVADEKFSYGVFGNMEHYALTEKFKREKRKAMFKPGRKQLHIQGGETMQYGATDHSFLLVEDKEQIYFGMVEAIFDSETREKRDMEKPVRREALAMSPRLSRILINLAGVQKGERLGDPFCGIGGVLLEGLALGIDVYGRDRDGTAIRDAKQNLQWYTKEYDVQSRYKVEKGDSQEFPEENFDGIAGEGPLGALLTRKAGREEARKMIETFERRIVPLLERLRSCVKKKGRIALTFPVVGEQHVDVKQIAKESGLKVVVGPIHEYREKQFVSRDVVVFE